jgi:PPOX class probable F420-dependent enzyme
MTTQGDLAAEKYVVITTTKRNGQAVPTPVWIAALPDGALGFTTDLGSGKVKRIRNNGEVTLQPSNSRGVVRPGTSPVAARATVLTDDAAEPVERAIKTKYGVLVTLVEVAYRLRSLVKRSSGSGGRAAIRLELL